MDETERDPETDSVSTRTIVVVLLLLVTLAACSVFAISVWIDRLQQDLEDEILPKAESAEGDAVRGERRPIFNIATGEITYEVIPRGREEYRGMDALLKEWRETLDLDAALPSESESAKLNLESNPGKQGDPDTRTWLLPPYRSDDEAPSVGAPQNRIRLEIHCDKFGTLVPKSGAEENRRLVGHKVHYSLDSVRIDGLVALREKLESMFRDKKRCFVDDPRRPGRKKVIAVVVEPGHDVVYGDVAPVVDLLLRVGFSDIHFGGGLGSGQSKPPTKATRGAAGK